ncbi:hypothetical protein ACMUG6_12860 [Staphylococcus aureus]
MPTTFGGEPFIKRYKTQLILY